MARFIPASPPTTPNTPPPPARTTPAAPFPTAQLFGASGNVLSNVGRFLDMPSLGMGAGLLNIGGAAAGEGPIAGRVLQGVGGGLQAASNAARFIPALEGVGNAAGQASPYIGALLQLGQVLASGAEGDQLAGGLTKTGLNAAAGAGLTAAGGASAAGVWGLPAALTISHLVEGLFGLGKKSPYIEARQADEGAVSGAGKVARDLLPMASTPEQLAEYLDVIKQATGARGATNASLDWGGLDANTMIDNPQAINARWTNTRLKDIGIADTGITNLLRRQAGILRGVRDLTPAAQAAGLSLPDYARQQGLAPFADVLGQMAGATNNPTMRAYSGLKSFYGGNTAGTGMEGQAGHGLPWNLRQFAMSGGEDWLNPSNWRGGHEDEPRALLGMLNQADPGYYGRFVPAGQDYSPQGLQQREADETRNYVATQMNP